jgi:DNA-binding transcriptional MerR regulator
MPVSRAALNNGFQGNRDMRQGANVGRATRAPRDGENWAAPGPDRPTTIGEVAREFSITSRALRFYEAKRLIAPQRNGALRLYGRSDRNRIALILSGRRLGFTLAEIKELVEGPGDGRLQLTREKCLEQINLLEQQKRGIELALGELRQIYTPSYKSLLEDRLSS